MGGIWLRRVREIPGAAMEIAKYQKVEGIKSGETRRAARGTQGAIGTVRSIKTERSATVSTLWQHFDQREENAFPFAPASCGATHPGGETHNAPPPATRKPVFLRSPRAAA